MTMIIGSTIDDAWRNTIVECYKEGYDYEVKGNIRKDEGGSYIGMIRRQLDSATIRINMPWVRPLAVIPPNPFPPPTRQKAIPIRQLYLLVVLKLLSCLTHRVYVW
jgi:hypothetical protein